MNAYELPESLEIGGVAYTIRTDFRAVLDILKCYADPEYEEDERALIMLRVLYIDWEKIPEDLYEEALRQGAEFIDMGISSEGKLSRCVMDWEQDAPIIIPAVNKVFGADVRGLLHLHWWTFLGAYMEIGESLYSTVLQIRQKKAQKKKLEKYEQDFFQQNRSIVELRRKDTEEQREEKNELIKMLDGK